MTELTGDELAHAWRHGRFTIEYQPIVRLRDGAWHGVEALLRWRTPTGRTVPPEVFIPVAEATALILPIGRWVIAEACAQAAAWRARGIDRPTTWVNVSPVQLRDPELVDHVRRCLARHGLAPTHLGLEVTETALIDAEGAGTTLALLRAIGVDLAWDDFGTGYASLVHLRNPHVSTVKVDRRFVGGLPDDDGDRAIVAGVLSLATTLGLRVVCEGVERADQAATLLALGCELAQGYHFAPPQPAHRLDEPRRIAAP